MRKSLKNQFHLRNRILVFFEYIFGRLTFDLSHIFTQKNHSLIIELFGPNSLFFQKNNFFPILFQKISKFINKRLISGLLIFSHFQLISQNMKFRFQLNNIINTIFDIFLHGKFQNFIQFLKKIENFKLLVFYFP